METTDTLSYHLGSSRFRRERSFTGDRLKLVEELIMSSNDLNLRVWLDGVYTDTDNDHVQAAWMNGREVYFKLEGSIERLKEEADR